MFLSELSSLLTCVSAMSPNVFLGDFNTHVDSPSCNVTNDFMSVLDCFDITEHVNFPTQNKGHVLELVCFSGVTSYNLNSNDILISDHRIILLEVSVLSSFEKSKHTLSEM